MMHYRISRCYLTGSSLVLCHKWKYANGKFISAYTSYNSNNIANLQRMCICMPVHFYTWEPSLRKTQNYSQDLTDNFIFDKRKILYHEFEFMKEEELVEFVCPKLYNGNDDPLMKSLENFITISDIFSTVNVNIGRLTIQHAVQAVQSLSSMKLIAEQNKLEQKFHSNTFPQSLLELATQLQLNPEFKILLNIIKENIGNMTDRELSATFMCLNHLSVPLHDDAMWSLHLEILKAIPVMTLISLTHITFALRNKGIKAYYTQSKMIAALSLAFHKSLSLDDFKCISLMLVNMKRLIPPSSPLVTKYLDVLQRLLDEGIVQKCSPGFKIMFLMHAHLLSKNGSQIKIYRALANSLNDCVADLTPGQIITVNRSILKQMEPRNIQFKLQEQASRIYNDYKDVNVQSDLLLCLSSQSTLKAKGYFEDLSLTKILLLQDHHNIVPLSRILRFAKNVDCNLCQRLWKHRLNKHLRLLEYAEDSIGTRESVLHSLYEEYIFINLLLGGMYRCESIEQEIVKLLWKEIEGSCQLIPTKLVNMAGFILAYSKEELPIEFAEKLMKIARQYNCYDVIFMSNCIGCYNLARHKNNRNARIVAKVCKLLDDVTTALLMDELSLEEISNLTRALILRQTSPHTAVFNSLVKEHCNHLTHLSSRSISVITKNFRDTCCSIKEINEAISNYIIENEASVSPNLISQSLTYFYSVGYQPSNVDDFTSTCRQVLEMTCEKINYSLMLESCLALIYFRSLSPQLIHYVFNEKFLEKLEEEIYSTFSERYSKFVRILLMQMNRAVCLDFPEERVPWFHEKYCQNLAEKDTAQISAFHQDVHDALVSILGNKNSISVNKRSPYFYNVDLEFSLDASGKPIPLLNYSAAMVQKKVALQLRDEDSFCLDKSTIVGPCQMERRHLEILGYAVVEVPQYAWHSMALGADADRRSYLESLIFKELS